MTTSSSGSRVGDAAIPVDVRGRSDDAAARAAWRVVETALPSLGALQRTALGIYGRLELDRALVWTVEDPARLEEELGQLTAWMLCLANILDVDITAAVGSAIREEIERQLAKYGKLKPYQAGG